MQLPAAAAGSSCSAGVAAAAFEGISCTANAVAAALEAADAALQQHAHQQQLLDAFYAIVCPSLDATADLAAYVTDMSSMEARLHSCAVEDVGSEAFWGMHWQPLQAAAQAQGLLGLTVFRNSLRHFAAAAAAAAAAEDDSAVQAACGGVARGSWSGQGLDDASMEEQPVAAAAAAGSSRRVADVVQLMPQLLQHFQAQWAAATEVQPNQAGSSSSRQAGPSVAAVLELWASEQAPDVAAEYAAVQHFGAQQAPTSHTAAGTANGTAMAPAAVLPSSVVAALLRLHHASRECALGEQLQQLQPAFSLSASPLLAAVQLLPKQPLSELQTPAVQLAEAFEGVEAGLGQLAGQLGLLQQLGRSEALQAFLAAASTDDLRRLVDGAEDHGGCGCGVFFVRMSLPCGVGVSCLPCLGSSFSGGGSTRVQIFIGGVRHPMLKTSAQQVQQMS